jgi:hypothetical protein
MNAYLAISTASPCILSSHLGTACAKLHGALFAIRCEDETHTAGCFSQEYFVTFALAKAWVAFGLYREV